MNDLSTFEKKIFHENQSFLNEGVMISLFAILSKVGIYVTSHVTLTGAW